jgi:type V secretory pathway adhesin AidA
MAQCKALYTQCSTTAKTYCTSGGEISYVTDCPCYNHFPTSETFNTGYSFTSSTCTGTFTAGTYSAVNGSPSPTPTPYSGAPSAAQGSATLIAAAAAFAALVL